MTWTEFHDMHSGGGQKEKWSHIFIEAPEAEAKVIFYNRFGHNPDRVTCTCCGRDYSLTEYETLQQATAYERGCRALETPRENGLYKPPSDPWWHEHYWLEPEEQAEAAERGWKVSDFPTYREHKTLEEYIAQSDVLVIRAEEIEDAQRSGSVPEEGYVWVG